MKENWGGRDPVCKFMLGGSALFSCPKMQAIRRRSGGREGGLRGIRDVAGPAKAGGSDAPAPPTDAAAIFI